MIEEKQFLLLLIHMPSSSTIILNFCARIMEMKTHHMCKMHDRHKITRIVERNKIMEVGAVVREIACQLQ